MPYTIHEIHEKQPNGEYVMRIEEVWVDEPTQEELIAQKEAELLKMYQELQALKQQNS